MACGHFHPLPPPFIGGRQPYAPSLGLPQSGEVPQAPPQMTRVNFDAIVRSEFYPPPPTYVGGSQPYAPRLGMPQSGPASSPPLPISSANHATIVRAHGDLKWTLIYTASIAPILSPNPAAPDNPPPSSYATLNAIVRQWQPGPHRPPPLKGVGQFSVAVTPDSPPRRDYVNMNLVARQNVLPIWWPLPKINNAAPPSGPNPPPSLGAIYLLLRGVG